MYKTGDHVFYPKGGVFVIEQESSKTIGGSAIDFFDLVSNDGKTKISIPTANVERVGVRRLVSNNELKKHLDTWAPDLKISKLHHKNRKSKFETMRQSGNFEDMGAVVVTIHYLIDKGKATFEEKRMYDQIRKRMVNEIQIVRNVSEARSETLLTEMLDEAIKRKAVEKPEETEEELEEEGAAV